MEKPSVTVVVVENVEAIELAKRAHYPGTVRSFRASVVPAVEGFFADGVDPEDAVRNLKDAVRRLFQRDMRLVQIFSMPVEDLFSGAPSARPRLVRSRSRRSRSRSSV